MMFHDPIRHGLEWHAPDCRCVTCEPYVPSTSADRLTPTAIALRMLAGFVLGLALCWLLDRIQGGPGLAATFGWR